MAVVEWKSRSGIGGVLDGDLSLPSASDERVYDDFVKALRQTTVSCTCIHIVLISLIIFYRGKQFFEISVAKSGHTSTK
jgi:hypothetical protein